VDAVTGAESSAVGIEVSTRISGRTHVGRQIDQTDLWVIGGELAEHLGGSVVTAPCTRDVGLIPEMMSGTGVIDVMLEQVSLLPGTYDVHTEITDFNRSHIYDHLTLAMRFDVMTGKPYESGGVVTLRPRWTID
jgi:hypothetical protein